MLTFEARKYRRLVRRLRYLDERIEGQIGSSTALEFDRAERSALSWALGVVAMRYPDECARVLHAETTPALNGGQVAADDNATVDIGARLR